MTGVFITGTGTEVGKTEVATRLIGQLMTRGVTPLPRKPVASGFSMDELWHSDPGRLMHAAGWTEERLDEVCPHRFVAPLAPGPAAALEGRTFGYLDFVSAARFGPKDGFRVVEGVGGLMVPLDRERTVLDAVVDLQLPVLLVAGTYLGTLSHILTAWTALRSRWTGPAQVVLSESEDSAMSLEAHIAELTPFLGAPPLLFPRGGPAPDLAAWACGV